MESISCAAENKCLEFLIGDSAAILFRPAILFFEYIPESAWNSFFLIETQPLEPSGVYDTTDEFYEEVLEVSRLEYVDRSYADQGNLGLDDDGLEIPIPMRSRIVCRYLQGNFLVVAQSSDWNKVSATSDGRHDHMTAKQIREQIQNQRIDPRRNHRRSNEQNDSSSS